MKLYAGIDLHSNNNFLGILDEQDKEVYKKKLPNDLKVVLQKMEPYRENLQGIAVESTFNWYWLVDGLMEEGFQVHLANPSAIKQYEGLKYVADFGDAFHLARLLKLGILPEGYIYPKETRPVRDLLRKRLILVRQRTAHLLSFQSLIYRQLGYKIKGDDIKKLTEEKVKDFFKDKHLILSGQANISSIRFFEKRIKLIEREVLKVVKIKEEYKNLLTIPGMGKILGQTTDLETGDVGRFSTVSDYVSYCRCVRSTRVTNDKVKKEGNSKCGNKYLGWTFVETAHFAIRHCQAIRKFYQRKTAKTNKIVGRKAVAHKLARAAYHIMKKQEEFDLERAFGR
jgi:transposase